MKKLMIVAAAAAMTVVAKAAPSFEPVDCQDPDETEEAACPLMVFKVTASGKTVQEATKKDYDYKTVKTLKVTKGALVFKYDEECAEAGLCCYPAADLYANVKVGSKTAKLAVADVVVAKWSVFGQNIGKALAYRTQIKAGKSVKLESDLFLQTEGAFDEPATEVVYVVGEDEVEDTIDFAASAFGGFTVKVVNSKTKVSSGYCDVETNEGACYATWTPGTYNGWFVGQRELLGGDSACFNCECGTYDVFGGTFKAVYDSKKTTDEAAQKYVFGKVLFADEDEDDED